MILWTSKGGYPDKKILKISWALGVNYLSMIKLTNCLK